MEPVRAGSLFREAIHEPGCTLSMKNILLPPLSRAARLLEQKHSTEKKSMSTATAEAPSTTKLSQLEALKKLTKVVADTGDFESMRALQAAGRDHQPEPHPPGRDQAGIRSHPR